MMKADTCNYECEQYAPFSSKRNILESCNDRFSCTVNWTVIYDVNSQPIYNSTSTNSVYSKMENFVSSLFSSSSDQLNNNSVVTYVQSGVKAYQIFSDQYCYNNTIGKAVKIFVLKENVTNALFVYYEDATGRGVGWRIALTLYCLLFGGCLIYCLFHIIKNSRDERRNGERTALRTTF